MPENLPYKTTFAARISKIHNSEIDKYIALAGLEKLKSLMPKDVDFEKNPDLLGVVLNAVVAGRMNANFDAVSNETGVEIAPNFVYKYVDSDHNRKRIIGTIVNYGFSKFGDNTLLTAEEAKNSKDPYNISLALLLFKAALPDEYIKLIEETSDETSANFGRLSGSWEMYFSEYDIAVGPKNVSEATILPDGPEKEKYKQMLVTNGGKGVVEGKYVYRVLKGQYLISGGIGLVESPAALVKGLYVVDAETNTQIQTTSKPSLKIGSETLDEDFIKRLKVIDTKLAQSEQIQNNNVEKISQTQTTNVKNDRQIMKIQSLQDITDETLKEATAAASVRQFIEEELRKKTQEYDAIKAERENAVKTVEDRITALAAEKEKLLASVQTLTQQVQTLTAEKEAQARAEKFTQRMASLDDSYVLTKESREVIASAIKDLSDEAFAAYEKNLKVFLADKVKTQEATASTKTEETNTVVDDALEKANKEKANITNTATGTLTFKQKYAPAFSMENFEVVVRK